MPDAVEGIKMDYFKLACVVFVLYVCFCILYSTIDILRTAYKKYRKYKSKNKREIRFRDPDNLDEIVATIMFLEDQL